MRRGFVLIVTIAMVAALAVGTAGADTDSTTDAPITCQTRFGAQPGTFSVTVTDDVDPVSAGGTVSYRINSPFKQTLPNGVSGTYRGGQVFYRIPDGLSVTTVTTQAPPGGSPIQSSAAKQGDDIVVTSSANVPIDGSTYPTPDLIVRGDATGEIGTQIRWRLPYRIMANVDITGVGPVDADCAPNNPATVIGTTSIVAQANRPPVVQDLQVPVPQDTAKEIELTATDPDGDAITFSVTQPDRGTLTGTPPNVTYTPDADFLGEDSFTFTARDSKGATATATVQLLVYADAEGDTFPPSVSVTTPAHGAVYAPGEVVRAEYECTDGESGIGSCSGSVADGAPISTVAGQRTFAVHAVDQDGNRSREVVSYRVIDPTPVHQSYDAGPDPADVIPVDCTGEPVVPFTELVPATAHAPLLVPQDDVLSFRVAVGSMSVPPATMATNARFVFAPPSRGAVVDVDVVAGTGSANVASSTAAIVDGGAVLTIPGPIDGGLTGSTFTPPALEVTIGATGAPTERIETRFDRYQVRMTTGIPNVDILTTDYDCPAGDADSANPVLTRTTIQDVTPPTVTLTSPDHGGRLLTGEEVLADYLCDDAHVVASCDGSRTTGQPVAVGSPGGKTFSVIARDAAGNFGAALASYRVFDPVVFTARFTAADHAAIVAAGQLIGVPAAEMPGHAVASLRPFLDTVVDNVSVPVPPPTGDRPAVVTTSYLPNDAVRAELDAARFGLSGDDYHWFAARVFAFIVYLLHGGF